MAADGWLKEWYNCAVKEEHLMLLKQQESFRAGKKQTLKQNKNKQTNKTTQTQSCKVNKGQNAAVDSKG